MSSRQTKHVLLISLIVLQASTFGLIRACFPGTSFSLLYVQICMHMFPCGYMHMPHSQTSTDLNYLVLHRKELPLAFVIVDSLPLFRYTSLLRVSLHLPSNLLIIRRVLTSNVFCRVTFGSLFPPIHFNRAYMVGSW